MMKSRIPTFLDKSKICIICEGDEEYDYLSRLKELQVWNQKYEINLDNADGNGNIPARYQDRYQNGSFDVVLVFCDTDKKPYEQYEDIKRKIDEFHGLTNIAKEVVIYGNPCTMQIILQHWADVRLKTSAKKVNAPLIGELTGVDNYKGRSDQRKKILNRITEENYWDMHGRVKNMESDDAVESSSNFGLFLDYFSNDDIEWINMINAKLEE